MTKAQALHQFWSSFGLDAIEENSAYDEPMNLPDNYITYEIQSSNLGEATALTASVWYKTTSWNAITQKVDAIAAYIGYGGKVLPIDTGYLWIKLGSPFAQRMDSNKDTIRRIVLNISVDFLTGT